MFQMEIIKAPYWSSMSKREPICSYNTGDQLTTQKILFVMFLHVFSCFLGHIHFYVNFTMPNFTTWIAALCIYFTPIHNIFHSIISSIVCSYLRVFSVQICILSLSRDSLSHFPHLCEHLKLYAFTLVSLRHFANMHYSFHTSTCIVDPRHFSGILTSKCVNGQTCLIL